MLRRLPLLLLPLCLSCAARAQVGLTAPLSVDADTVALYHLDDLATGQFVDAAGGPSGTVTDGQPSLGRFGGALSFDGLKSYADIKGLPRGAGVSPATAAGAAGLTVECWAKFRKGAQGDIICRNQAYMMRISGAIQAYISIDGKWRTVNGARAIAAGRWTHLAMTYDAATRQVRTYVDGRLDVTKVPDGLTAGKLDVGDSVLRLGTNTWNPAPGLIDGKLDEVRISSVARTFTPLSPPVTTPVALDENLLPNPSFECGLQGWRTDGEANTRTQWSIESAGAPQGKAFVHSLLPGGYTIITYPLTTAPGKPHTLSAELRADKPTRVRMALCCTDVPQDAPRPSLANAFDVTPTWQRFAAKLAVPEDWPTDRAYVLIAKPPGVTLDVDAVSLLVGNRTEYAQPEAQSVGLRLAMPPANTFPLGVPASVRAQVVNLLDRQRQLALHWQIDDRPTNAEPAHEFAPSGEGEATLRLPCDRVGWFRLTCWVAEPGNPTRFAEQSLVYNVVEAFTGKGAAATSPLGMNTHMERETTEDLNSNLGTLAQCGVKWIRAWWGWGMAEKEPGKFDWTEFDRQYDAAHEAGMEIMPILLRYYPPYEQAWAGKMDEIQEPPHDLNQWGSFVNAVVRRYKGRVHAWEVWNEPESTMEAPEYARILKVTYERAKAADPDATIVGFGGCDLKFIQGVFDAGSAKSMDVLSHHPYNQLAHPFGQLAKLATDTETLTEAAGATQRVWDSEQGTGADGAGYLHMGQTEEQCAVNLVQGYLSAFATRVERFFWFSAQTSPTYGWGVFYEDYIPRPRLVAVNGLARLLQGRKVTGRQALADGKVACVLLDGPAGPAAALWNVEGSAFSVEMSAANLSARDMLYNPLVGAADGGRLRVTIEKGRPVYILAAGTTLSDLAARMFSAKIAPAGPQNPVEVSAEALPDGRLRIRLRNVTDSALDLRLTVTAPALFAAPPKPEAVVDLLPQRETALVLTPDKKSTSARIGVGVEVGDHGIARYDRNVTVKL